MHLSRQLRSLAAASLLALACAHAQAPGDVRVALVIGNAAYAGAAALANPVNDAAAMASTLKQLGFAVVELRDSKRADMAQAIEQVKASLRGKQGIGMLYYAGHGLQVDWHNYMVPVDASLANAADVPRQTIDINEVIEAFKAAGNRTNILVLDACRDNPFAGSGAGRGLAQLDAPPGTFLAYATAPGNVADDGDPKASNGLYTGFLVGELSRPQAKIEDVFKRVRLQVRQKSGGRQIPWESTSLEDDFFFNLGVKVLKPDEKAREEAFAREKADWDRIKDSKSADDFFEFLKKYPNGSISEAAQDRLDRLARAQVMATPVQGREAEVVGERFKLGNTSEYAYYDGLTKLETRRETVRVTAIKDDVVEVNGGEQIITRTGGVIRNDTGINFDPPLQIFPAGEYQVGKKWTARSIQTRVRDNLRGWVQQDMRIAAYEEVTVKAGKFKTYRLESDLSTQNGARGKVTWWVSPSVGVVKYVRQVRLGNGRDDSWERELVAYSRG